MMLGFLVFLVIFCVVAYFIYKKFYLITVDNTLMISGAPGTGKTNELVRTALKLRRILKARIRWKNRFDRWFHKGKNQKPYPLIFSNIPIRIGRYSKRQLDAMKDKLRALGASEQDLLNVSRNKFCEAYKFEYMTNQEQLPEKSITVITEIGKFLGQNDWANLNIQDHVRDHISFYRQYTKGGYFLADEQSVDFIVKELRLRFGTCINMLHFGRVWKIYWQKVRNFTISEDFKVIEEGQAEEAMKWHIGMFPLFHRNYDTYAFSDRYKSVPKKNFNMFIQYKTNEILELPVAKKTMYQGQELIEGFYLPNYLTKKNRFHLTKGRE